MQNEIIYLCKHTVKHKTGIRGLISVVTCECQPVEVSEFILKSTKQTDMVAKCCIYILSIFLFINYNDIVYFHHVWTKLNNLSLL